MDVLAVSSRLKREECNRTIHDSNFYPWKILIEHSDWEECPKGKEGCERYRIHNLPLKSDPGVYELGIAAWGRGLGREIYKLDPGRIVVVYLGQADNVRARLQRYGRNGAHLDSNNHSSPQKGRPFFQQIFSQGFSIVYRWAPMQNKEDAPRTEAELLRTYDYAWNTINNGTPRPDDILQKLNKIASGTRVTQRQVGIRIKSSKVPLTDDRLDEADDGSYNFQSRVINFNRSRPRIIQETTGIIQNWENAKICGVPLRDGSICRRPPVEKRLRCPEHKGMRTNASTAKAIEAPKTEKTGIIQVREIGKICGVALRDGSICTRPPAEKRERCPEHKGMRTNSSTAKAIKTPNEKTVVLEPEVYCQTKGNIYRYQNVSQYVQYPPQAVSITNAYICGIILNDGSTCRREPVKGRKRCHEHKGMRISGYW